MSNEQQEEKTSQEDLQELVPDRREYENELWYFAGVFAATLMIGLINLTGISGAFSATTLTLVGGIGTVGVFTYMVIRDD